MASDIVTHFQEGTNEYLIFSVSKLLDTDFADLMRQVILGDTPATQVSTRRRNGIEFKCFVLNLDADWKRPDE